MSKTFNGLCVGGPLDGQQLSHTGPRYRVPVFGEAVAAAPNEPSYAVHEYLCVPGLRGIIEIDFWVPVDRDASWAISEIVKAYGAKDGA
jgi:hypothetical protein